MTLRTAALAALSGLLLASIFPTWNAAFLAWIALAPLLIALRGQSVKNGFLLGFLSGLFYFCGAVYWVINSVYFYGNIPFVPALLITLLLCAYLALYPAFFGAGIVFINRNRPSLLLLAAPALWVSLELARTYVFSGFPWALLGYSQYRVLPVIQAADIAGVYGISFLIVFVNAALVQFVSNGKKAAPLVSAAVMIVLVLGYGYVRLDGPEKAGSIKISVVQGNIEQDKKWDAAYQAATINTYTRLTEQALKERPDLIVWPETATPFYFQGNNPEDRRLSQNLMDFVKRNNVPLLFGSPTYEVKAPKKIELHNSAFLISAEGTVVAGYRKFHLVPFGEYVPLKSVLFFVEKMVQAIGDFVSGTEYTVMTLPAAATKDGKTSISTVICYEIIFPDLVRKFVGRGAGILTTITNDAWFGKTAAPYQHFSMAVFRAVENRVPVARAANTGISGFIDSRGRILASTDIFTEAALTRTVTPGGERAFYTRYGDLFSYLCILLTGLLFLDNYRKRAS